MLKVSKVGTGTTDTDYKVTLTVGSAKIQYHCSEVDLLAAQVELTRVLGKPQKESTASTSGMDQIFEEVFTEARKEFQKAKAVSKFAWNRIKKEFNL